MESKDTELFLLDLGGGATKKDGTVKTRRWCLAMVSCPCWMSVKRILHISEGRGERGMCTEWHPGVR